MESVSSGTPVQSAFMGERRNNTDCHDRETEIFGQYWPNRHGRDTLHKPTGTVCVLHSCGIPQSLRFSCVWKVYLVYLTELTEFQDVKEILTSLASKVQTKIKADFRTV